MALTGTFNFSVTLTDVVREMMLNVGAIGEAEVPTAQEFNDCTRKLNMIIKQNRTKGNFANGMQMWTRQRGDLFLASTKHAYNLGPSGDNWAGGVTGSSGLYNQSQTIAVSGSGSTTLQVSSITNINAGDYIGVVYFSSQMNTDLFWTTVSGPPTGSTVTLASPLTGQVSSNAYVFNYTTKQQRPLGIVTSLLRDIYNNDTPQNPLTVEDYEVLPSKTMPTFQSDPTAYYYESSLGDSTNLTIAANSGAGKYYIDVGGAQDVTKHLHMVFLRTIMDITNANDNPEFPQEYYRALCWAGSREICAMFDCTWTADMQANYTEAIAMAREPDGETTTFYFQRDAGSFYDP